MDHRSYNCSSSEERISSINVTISLLPWWLLLHFRGVSCGRGSIATQTGQGESELASLGSHPFIQTCIYWYMFDTRSLNEDQRDKGSIERNGKLPKWWLLVPRRHCEGKQLEGTDGCLNRANRRKGRTRPYVIPKPGSVKLTARLRTAPIPKR